MSVVEDFIKMMEQATFKQGFASEMLEAIKDSWEYKALKATIDKPEEVKDMKYTTICGDEIIIGECYETRDGRKAFVCELLRSATYPVVGILNHSEDILSWSDEGRQYSDTEEGQDLMRPWPVKALSEQKIVVTDDLLGELVNIGQTIESYADRKKRMKAALEAVFDMVNKESADTRMGLESELDIVVKQIFRASDLDKLKEITKKNFPDKWMEEKESEENEQWDEVIGSVAKNNNIFKKMQEEKPLDDGWIRHTTGKQPVDDDVLVDAKFSDGIQKNRTAKSLGRCWAPINNPTDEFTIIAYRIISEPEKKCPRAEMLAERRAEEEERAPTTKQTLLEYVEDNILMGSEIRTRQIFKIISEYLEERLK